MSAPVHIIVAVGPSGVIGKDGTLPWHLPEDLKHFRKLTTGHPIVMGRKTFESIGKPLPNRLNIVVSQRLDAREGVTVVPSLAAAIEAASAQTEFAPPVYVIGGASLYAEALPIADVIELTDVARAVNGDTFFPPFNRAHWQETQVRKGETEGVVFRTLCKKKD